ncbi:hypothetical protein Tsubulata_006991 [Turnera subulata]|uniref:Myb-like domain-containing protein n=1 Tax=Turnera subulata TaxID=218843 RepID=A0A9Q0IZZ3_9ROSI|nr:hypothetical protein Tsubulata_006991 [Turnera subulata]
MKLSLMGNADKPVHNCGCGKPEARSDCKSAEQKPKKSSFNGSSGKFLDHETVSVIRRSPRLSLMGSAGKHVVKGGCDKPEKKPSNCKPDSGKSKQGISSGVSKNSLEGKWVSLNSVNDEVGADVGGEKPETRERRGKRSSGGIQVVLGLKSLKSTDASHRNEKVRVVRKRKRGEEADNARSVQGWTREQEMALHRAYFAAKPTPNFWKKVSKLVPGKSAQECFDKVNSDHATPPQPLRRSRTYKIDSSPPRPFVLSANKLLNHIEMKNNRFSCNKQKTNLAHRTIRKLLDKQNCIDRDEADLFSILEPDENPSIQDAALNTVPCTLNHVEQNRGVLHRCQETSPDRRRPLSRFSSSCVKNLVSPPVLKQVKNKALHEKYIDQLHKREAKRKSVCARAGRSEAGKEMNGQTIVQRVDVVRAAKTVLVSDVRDAINQLQNLEANAMGNSTDFDNSCSDSENEIEE